jgi:hypothetical protein
VISSEKSAMITVWGRKARPVVIGRHPRTFSKYREHR